ncbi:hypothetical protein [Methylobacterium brachiatum]
MNWLRTITRELVGLVVDDVGFAAAIVAWIACAWILSAYVLPPASWHAVMLFGGLALILLESVVRRAGAPR